VILRLRAPRGTLLRYAVWRGSTGEIMRTESWVGVTAMLLMMLVGAVGAEQQQCRSVIPSNVDVPRDLERILERIYSRSPAFQAQCERIGKAVNLRVRVRINAVIPSRCRAFTIVQRRGREIRADVHLPVSSHLAELVAHEFEHVIEQIEGLNLRKLARAKGSGVHEMDRQVFETDRAQAAGRVVAAEASDYRRTPAAD
jgi:hypothetical protein